MTARILVVDDVLPNVKLLEACLTAEYFDVRTATNGLEAIKICNQGLCDIVLLDVMMPGLDGFETCRRLKAEPATAHLPVVLVTALDQPADRLRGLESGADDFLSKPIDEMALIARVRSLARIKVMIDELRNRAATSASFGLQVNLPLITAESATEGKILVVEDRASWAQRTVGTLAKDHRVELESDPQEALFRSVEGGYDMVVVSLALRDFDALRLCGQIRSIERTRQMPILLLADSEDRDRVVRGLDIGVNDYLFRPIDQQELTVRVRIQMRRKRYTERLNEILTQSIQLAVIDSLTGLHNRRYLESHLGALVESAADRKVPLSLMILDIDHFKAVNDTYGHDAGDEVLQGFANRVKTVIRGVDLLCRMGGEEFIIVMPETTLEVAGKVAERVRREVGGELFAIDKGARAIKVTVSIGIADRRYDRDASAMLKRADKALYKSKSSGRNRVSADAA